MQTILFRSVINIDLNLKNKIRNHIHIRFAGTEEQDQNKFSTEIIPRVGCRVGCAMQPLNDKQEFG